jgi:hypothetical protein
VYPAYQDQQARVLMVQALTLLIRKQIEALIRHINLPPQIEVSKTHSQQSSPTGRHTQLMKISAGNYPGFMEDLHRCTQPRSADRQQRARLWRPVSI